MTAAQPDSPAAVSYLDRLNPAQRRAVVSVRDTGVGIDPAVLPRVFEAYTQADRSLERSRGGLGVGLALVKGLVELPDGHGLPLHVIEEAGATPSAWTVKLLPVPVTPAPFTAATEPVWVVDERLPPLRHL